MGCQESVMTDQSFQSRGMDSGTEVVFGSGVHVGRTGNVNLSYRRMSYLDAATVKLILDDELKRTATSLQLNGNLLYTLGKELLMLPHVQQIDLEENRFQRVPEILVNLTKLWRINLSSNPLDSKSFGPTARIPNLKSLALRDCSLTSVPEPIFRCLLLEELDLSNNPNLVLERAPLANIKNLQSFFISNCNLSGNRLPLGLLNVSSLKRLDISGNRFEFPEMNFFGTKIPLTLKVLHLRNLKLSAVPQAVSTLRELHSLDLAENPIQTLDVLAGRLVKRLAGRMSASGTTMSAGYASSAGETEPITENVDTTSMQSAPISLSKVSKAGRIATVSQPIPLKRLSLCGCGLRTVPKYFHKLQCLEELDLSDNTELDDPNMTLFSLENLRVLNVIACPFADDPSRSRNEWYDIGKLRNLRQLDWEVWKGASNISAYRTRIPIEICGLPLTRINEVDLRQGLFVSDTIDTVINLLKDGYFKVDLAMDESTVFSHIEALRVFEQGRLFFFPNNDNQKKVLEGEIKGKGKDIHSATKLIDDIAHARLRISISRYIFFLTVQAANYDATIIPPLDVMILHYAHIVINPVQYRADCEAICGRILNCNYRTFFMDSTRFAAAAKDSVLASKKVWNLMARTTQDNLVWLHYDFWYKRARRLNDSNATASPPSGIRRLPGDPFCSIEAAMQEYNELCQIKTSQDLSSMLDKAITAHFEARGIDGFYEAVKQLFETNTYFFQHESRLQDLSVDWSRYVKYLSLFALYNSKCHEAPGVVVESLADVPAVFEPMAPRRNTSLMGKRYDEYENAHLEVGADGSPLPEMKPMRTSSYLTGKKNKTPASAIQALHTSPVPTVGLIYLLHAHRTAHVKYYQILTLFGLEANDITWENTKFAADETCKTWEALYGECYVGNRKNIFLYELQNVSRGTSIRTEPPAPTGEIANSDDNAVYQKDAISKKSSIAEKGKRSGRKQVTLCLGSSIM